MSSPLDLIKKGFQNKDWNLIQESYKILTGIDLIDTEPIKKIKIKIIRGSGSDQVIYDEPLEDQAYLPKQRAPRSRPYVVYSDYVCHKCNETFCLDEKIAQINFIYGDFFCDECRNQKLDELSR